MKTFKDIINEVADPKPRREKAFKDKHVVQKIDHPVGEEDQFVATNVKKDKTKKASHHDGEDVAVYEAVEISHDRYMRSHGKKASGGHGMWMFTHKRMGDVDHKDEKEVHTASGKFSDAAKSAKAWAKKHGHSTAYVMEEVEQIDELSQDTLWNYHAKAGADLQKKREKLAKGTLTTKDYKQGRNRAAGLNRAADKMHEEMSDAEMKKREDIVKGMKKNKEDFKKRYGDRWKSVMYATATKNAMKESVEQIDEISRDTARSYIRKASDDNRDRKTEVMKPFPMKQMGKNIEMHKKFKKREAGIELAGKKVYGIGGKAKVNATESVDLDEAFKAGSMKLKDGSSATVTKESADVLNSLFKQLNSANKAKMEERLMSGTKGFNEILAFAKEAV